MFIPLIALENLHGLLRGLYADMMPLCSKMIGVSAALAGIGALLFISYRVWQSLARAEPLDFFPLLRPFALLLCITLFNTFVLGSLNGLLSPVVKATQSLMSTQTDTVNQLNGQKKALEESSRERLPADSYFEQDEEMERRLDELGLDDHTQNTLNQMEQERSSWSLKGLLFKGIAWLLEWLFAAAAVVLDVLRTFYLIILSILGPLAFGISVFDGFQNTLMQWLSKYISIYLWLPIADLFSAIIARLQSFALRHDAALMEQDYAYFFDTSNVIYLIFMLVAICGYFCIPSISSWIVQANGVGGYNRTVSHMTSVVTGAAGWAVGKSWSGLKKMTGVKTHAGK